MRSYVVYALARHIRYKGLICKGEVGIKKGQLKVYDCYPQLRLHEKQFRRVNDMFTMYLTRLLQGGLHMRLSKGAMALVEKYGSWFIQFPTFSYIRIQGCSYHPYHLPRYPTDRMVLLEVVRQLTEFDFIQKEEDEGLHTLSLLVS